jgi:hypothetical protein
VLDIARTHAAIIACHASEEALDSLPAGPDVHACRVAEDELLLIAPPALGAATHERAAAHLARADASALVLDQSDGWAAFSLRGSGALRVLAQLSVISFPASRPAFVQGAVAGGPAKILLVAGAVHVFVPFTLRHYVEGRLRDVCGNLARITATEVPFWNEPSQQLHTERAADAAVR